MAQTTTKKKTAKKSAKKSNEPQLKSQTFSQRLHTMMTVDFRRMFTMPMLYIMIGIAFVMPILILVMTTMTAGSTMVDPQTGVETTMEAFTNTWQAIATSSSDGMAMGMDLTGMCNINLMYFMAGVYVCLFVADDFRSGYAKNLFTVRSKKTDYVASKTIACFVGGALMLLAFFVGTVIGGAAAGLPFDLGEAGVSGLVMCMLAKVFLMAVFVPIFLTMSVIAKQKSWMSILLSLFAGMLLFMMIPMMSPLDAGVMNVGLCLVGGAMFSFGLGAVSNLILRKTNLV